ncbi:protein of unknown function [Candidatus Methylocalor cossyra]|uniref:Uncharacterized protein n=1 Tax=Candidatus Methylocalor cossyra TaxID=3108543 RepID=A0ABP1C828_9GAMM
MRKKGRVRQSESKILSPLPGKMLPPAIGLLACLALAGEITLFPGWPRCEGVHCAPSPLVFARHPALTGTRKERCELANGLGVPVVLSDRIRIGAATPISNCDDVSWRFLIDENSMRNVAVETAHVRPHLAGKTKSLVLLARFQPRIPNHRDHPRYLAKSLSH